MPSEGVYEVEYITQARFDKRKGREGRWKYLVKWVGYGLEDNSWQVQEDFDGDIVDHFWERVNVGGRDRNDVENFKNGEVAFATGPPVKKTAKRKGSIDDSTAISSVSKRKKNNEQDSAKSVKAARKRKPKDKVEPDQSVSSNEVSKPISIEWEPPETIDEIGLLERHRGKIVHVENGRMGTVTLIQIHREKCDNRFLALMKAQDNDLGQLATALFANDGSLRRLLNRDFCPHRHRLYKSARLRILENLSKIYRGSDCFDTALAQFKRLFYLQEIEVSPDINISDIFPALLDSNILCAKLPYYSMEDFSILSIPNEHRKIYQSCGFRRVGRTHYFVYASSQYDESRLLPVGKDIGAAYDTPSTFPVHFAIAWMEDDVELEAELRAAFSADPASILQKDNLGYTPLLLACHLDRRIAIRCLLSLDCHQNVLRDLYNVDRLTPIIAMIENWAVALKQEFWVPTSNIFPPEARALADTLRDATGEPLASTCTCSSCENGWLSPRMKARLQVTASNISHEMMEKELSFPARPRMPLSVQEFQKDRFLYYLPYLVRENVLVSVYRGYRHVVDLIEQVLLGRELGGTIPYVELVERLIPDLSLKWFRGGASESEERFFKRYGGGVRHALDCVTDIAAKEVDQVDSSLVELTANMPTCSNDVSFEIVRKNLGIYTPYIVNYDQYTPPSAEEIRKFRLRNGTPFRYCIYRF